jgi:L-2-hydroxyglutarate oxidase LhgO
MRRAERGSLSDLFESAEMSNIVPLLSVAYDNLDLTEYRIGQLLQPSKHRFATLQKYLAAETSRDHSNLLEDAGACRRVRADTAAILNLQKV